ncbi:MAG: metallophosphoesterase, partial [Oscillospiraceae bacterium]|nr:metallophosphoesterase [Oscillospiraceae bacterium]
NAISKVKALQDMGGKDLVNFVHFSDMHYNSDRTNYTDNLGAVAARLMMELDIPLMVGTGDITESGTASSSAMIDADVEQALETLEPVGLENLLYCKGNHDGAWGAKADYGVNYAMIQHPDKLWNRLYRWQAEDFRRVFSEDGSYYYIDNIPQKVRYIVLNAHWADYSNITDLDYDAQATEYNTQKNINYGDEQAEWLAKTALDFADKKGWTVVVFTHPPLWNKHNGVIKSYMNVQYAGTNNASTIRSILMGFYNKESAVAYKSGSTVDYSGIDESNTVAGVFTGHCHTDIATKYDESGTGTNIPFPIISVTSAGNANSSYEEGFGYPVTTRTNGTDTETAFDIVCINKKTKTINTVRVGAGSDRSITYSEEEDVPVTLLSISAVYSGGSVEVGTSINSLTGITVTAHYSDGSTENVTGYTLSGSISNAGNNTITVSYGGKTATFTVEGIGIEEETTVPIVWKNGYKCTYAVGSACTVSADASYIITEEIPVSYGKTYSFTGGPAGANGTLKFVGVDSSDKVTEAKDFNIVSGKTASFSWTPTNASTAGLRLRSYSNAIGDIKNSTVMDIS